MTRRRAAKIREKFSTARAALDVLGIVGLLIGGCFAAVQYLSARNEARVNRTMEYIERYEQGEIAAARHSINETLRPFLPQFQELEAEKAVSRDVKRDLVLSIIESSQNEATEQRINAFAASYDRVADGTPESLAERRELVRSAIASPVPPNVAQSVDRLVDYFEGLRTCVAEGICDERVAIGYFSKGDSPELWNNFWPYMEQRRKNNARYASGLEWFATRADPKSR